MGVKRRLSHWWKNTDFGVLEHRVLWKIFRPKRENQQDTAGNVTRKALMCSAHQILFGWSNHVWDARGTWHVWRTEEVHTEFWYLKKWNLLEDRGVDSTMILSRNFKSSGKTWTGLIWHWLETNGSLLTMQQWTSAFHKVRGNLTRWGTIGIHRRAQIQRVT
jgi:hypothetical protein